MKNFDEVYNDIITKYKNNGIKVTNDLKDIKKVSFIKLIKILLIFITIIFIFLLFKLYVFAIIVIFFLPLVLFINISLTRGKMIRENIMPQDNIMKDVFKDIINNGFDNINYVFDKDGLEKIVYQEVFLDDSSKYESNLELFGKLPNDLKFNLSYVAAWNEFRDSNDIKRSTCWMFRGYVFEIDLDNYNNINAIINKSKIDGTINEITNKIKDEIASYDMQSECVIKDNKLFIRIQTNAFDFNLDDILNKDIIKKYYDNINNIIDYATNISNLLK